MAYTSDLRIKNFLKETDQEVRNILSKYELDRQLNLRIYDESDEDALLWDEGGLAFKDPQTGNSLGSNDGAWNTDNSYPLIVVEGTFGTERGQFGDGQLNRVSHSLGVALNGFVGVTLVPYKGQSFIKKGTRKDIESKNINYSNGLLHKGMVTLALRFSKNNIGKFLIIDPYEENLLRDLVVAATLNYFNKDNNYDEIINRVLKNMADYLGVSKYGSRSNQTIQILYDKQGNKLNGVARFYTQNFAALTTSSKRDGHGLLGKNLIELHSTNGDLYSIFIRLTKDNITALEKRKSKEFSFLMNNHKIKVKSVDDLIFLDKKTKEAVIAFQNNNLHQQSEKKLIKEIQAGFNSGNIRINV
jgi:hypothetical protein